MKSCDTFGGTGGASQEKYRKVNRWCVCAWLGRKRDYLVLPQAAARKASEYPGHYRRFRLVVVEVLEEAEYRRLWKDN